MSEGARVPPPRLVRTKPQKLVPPHYNQVKGPTKYQFWQKATASVVQEDAELKAQSVLKDALTSCSKPTIA